MTYKLAKNNLVVRLRDDTYIPAEPTLIDYQEYQEWVKAGNSPLPADPDPASTPVTAADKLASIGLTVSDLLNLMKSPLSGARGTAEETR